MFALRNVCMRSSAVVRLKHQWSVTRTKGDPGIAKRTSLFEHAELEEIDVDDDLESDFMNVHKSHKQYVRDLEIQNKRLQYLIVKRKYFKQKFPNFLSWHDKEQIKYLHSTDPEQWTIDQLSDSFPALPEIIQKVIKAKYSKNESQIARHDEAVQRNWQMFENGAMPDLPDSLVEHLKKFTSRSRIFKSSDHLSNKEEVHLRNRVAEGEFSEIISSYKKLKKPDQPSNGKAEASVQLQISADPTISKDSYLTATLHSTNMVTLGTLEQKIQKRAAKGAKISEEDKLILLQGQKSSDASQKAPVVFDEMDLTAIIENKYETRSVVPKSEKDYSHLTYPEKILIPKDKVKKGRTYKLHDCYYDSDGKFLYRVPGMY